LPFEGQREAAICDWQTILTASQAALNSSMVNAALFDEFDHRQ
jgi:hypothetical protein